MAYDLGTAHGKIELEYTGRSAVDRAEADMHRLGDGSKDTDGELKKLGKTLRQVFSSAGQIAKFSAIGVAFIEAGAAAGNLVVELLGMVPALTSILSLSSALPGAFIGIAAGVGVLKASFAGIQDAIKAAFDTKHPEKFNETLKNLSPSAQDFAKAVKASSDGLRVYQQSIQEAFFSSAHLADEVPRLVGGLSQIHPQLIGLAKLFGDTARQVVNFGASADSITFVQRSIQTFRDALAEVTPNIVPILSGLRAVGTVGLPLLTQLGSAVGTLAGKFADWLNAIASDGRLQQWIDTALATLRTLGSIVTNLGTVFFNLFKIAGDTGANFLNTLDRLAGSMEAFTSSASGQAALTSLFTGLAAVAQQLTPVITTLVGALAGALGPAIATIATTLGPALLQVVEELAPAFAPLATAIADLVTALTPILPPLAQLIALLAEGLAAGVTALTDELGPLIGVLAQGLSGAITALLPAFQAFAPFLGQAAIFGAQLAEAFTPLVPLMVQFAEALGGSLIDNLPMLVQASEQLAPAVLQLATSFAELAQVALPLIIAALPTVVGAIVTVSSAISGLVTFILTVIGAFLSFGATLVGAVASVVAFGQGVINGIQSAMSTAISFVSNAISAIINFFATLPGRVIAAISGFVSGFPSITQATMNRAAFAVGAAIGTIISFFASLPGRAVAAAASLGGRIAALARAAVAAMGAAVRAGVSNTVAFFQALPGRAASAISSLPGRISSLASSAMSRLTSAVRSGVSSAVSAMGTLVGRCVSAISGFAGALAAAGRDAVAGLVNGIRSGVGAAAAAARSLGASVLSGIKSTLKIGSPSKEMALIGRFINQGLINGLTGTSKQVQAAANKIANMVADAYSDKLISKRTRNSVLSVIAKTNKQLQSLVAQSTSVAARLKTAQANLTTMQTAYAKAAADAAKNVQDSFDLVRPGEVFINIEVLKRRFAAAVSTAQQFAKDMATLTKRGLSKELLQQLADAGASAGGAMAKALAKSSDSDLKQLNNLQGQLNTAATSVGKVTADALYGAGVRAAQGLVNGLASQEKNIEQLMANIANRMAGTIRKALKIHSPSRVMEQVGKFIGQGLLDGILAMVKQVEAAGAELARSAIAPTLGLTGAAGLTGPVRAAAATTAGAIGAAAGVVVNQTVNALPGMSAKAVGDYSVSKIRFAVQGVSAALPAPLPQGVS